jgi:hypothetical protein
VRVLNHNKKFFSVSNIGRLFAVILAALICSGAFTVTAHAQASDVYITPDGGGNGICSNNAHPPSWFNNSSNWGSGGTQIGPGTIVHLCGTFNGSTNSTLLVARGSGTSGNPVTILFESGTNLTSQAWSGATGAINISGHSYLVVDGGSNGIIQNTNNGTNLGLHQADSVGVFAGGPSGSGCSPGCRITNLTIANMYVHTSVSDCSIDQTGTNAVMFLNTAGIRVDHNTFHDMGWAINGWGSNIEIDHNNVYNIDHGTASGANANTAGALFHDNHFHNFANWDTSGNCYHHDGIHIWNSDPNVNSNVLIYNNLFDGDSGVNITGYVYTENKVSNIKVFNNTFILAAGRTMGGMLWMGNYYDVAPGILNNTFIGQGSSACVRLENNSGVVWENNVVSGCNTFLSYVQGTTVSLGDYNAYLAQSPGGGNYAYNLGSTETNDLATWRSASRQDSHSRTSTVAVNSDGTLPSSSPAIGAGTNLSNLGIAALNADASGKPRPSSGAWDAGAHNSGATVATVPTPPTNLKATVQ